MSQYGEKTNTTVLCHPAQNGWTPLLAAASGGHSDVVTTLLNARASVDKATNHEETPLSVAAFYGHEGMVTMLLNARWTRLGGFPSDAFDGALDPRKEAGSCQN
ncbi:hypothetical protein FOA52_010995 [Chlamydomonas sp. UWO 241]|nr:hypothetical protein FOA52_010995 [Chlamydomonas sp. UWO 241]